MQLLTRTLPWKPTHILPLGDIQWAGKGHFSVSLGSLLRNIKRALAYEQQGHTVLFAGMGDYIDFASPSNRARLAAADLYDTAVDVIDAAALSLMREIYDEALEQTKGKWAFLLEGHHFTQLTTGATTDMELAKLLKAPFAGTSVVMKFTFAQEKSQARVPFVVWAHHGCGNGQTLYYPLSRLEKVHADWEGVDVYMMGHTTKQGAAPINRIRPQWHTKGRPDLTHRTGYLVGTGGYSKAYAEFSMQGRVPRGGYAEKGMMRASVLGSPIIHINPVTEQTKGVRHSYAQISVEVW
jgi:hypothetical protein